MKLLKNSVRLNIKNLFDDLMELIRVDSLEKGYYQGHHVFTDGSYKDGVQGYAYIVLEKGKLYTAKHNTINKAEREDIIGSRNIAPELSAVMRATQLLSDIGVKSATFHYDYEGIEKWYTGEWKAKKKFTKEYVEFMKNKRIEIEWIKEDAHTEQSSRLHQAVDFLAKEAV